MATKILSIEIGEILTRVVEIDYKAKNPKVYNLCSFETPDQIIVDGRIEDKEGKFAAALSEALKANGISTTKAMFVLRSGRIANREVEIPNVKDNRIGELVAANSSEYFPVDMDMYEVTYDVIGRIDTEEGKKIKLGIVAVPKDIIGSYQSLSNACGLSVVGFDYVGNAIKQLMSAADITATLKVDELTTILTIMNNDKVLLQRILNYGIGDTVAQIGENDLFKAETFIEAMDIVRQKTCIKLRFDSNGSDEPAETTTDDEDIEKLVALRAETTDSLRVLLGAIGRVLQYFQGTNPDVTINRIYLTGLGTDFSGLSKLMTNELGVKVVSLQEIQGVNVAKELITNNYKIAEYFAGVGAAIAPLGFMEEKKEKKRKASSEKSATTSFAVPVIICAACIIAAVALSAYGYMTNSVLKAENARLKSSIETYSYINDIYAEYESTQADYNWAMQIKDVKNSENNNLVALIEEFEKKMPSEIRVLTLSAGESSVSLNIQVNSKNAVADVISTLRNFETIDVGTVSSISETKDEAGKSTVSFSVDCIYRSKSAPVAEAAPAAEETTESTEETAEY